MQLRPPPEFQRSPRACSGKAAVYEGGVVGLKDAVPPGRGRVARAHHRGGENQAAAARRLMLRSPSDTERASIAPGQFGPTPAHEPVMARIRPASEPSAASVLLLRPEERLGTDLALLVRRVPQGLARGQRCRTQSRGSAGPCPATRAASVRDARPPARAPNASIVADAAPSRVRAAACHNPAASKSDRAI